jgi:hypothetical protein
MLEVLGIKHASKLVPLEEDQKPKDPVTENQNVLKGKPLKAFSYQDHEAHIKVHQMAMQDPSYSNLLGRTPWHRLYSQPCRHTSPNTWVMRIATRSRLALGVALAKSEDELPDEMEKEISRLMAEAAPQVLGSIPSNGCSATSSAKRSRPSPTDADARA